MASSDTTKTWIPYMDSKDCSQGFCSLYCPQWCSIIFPPPPPPFDDFSDDDSSSTFSPLIIAIIGILASAFLLVSYYTIMSKYCGNNNDDLASSRRENLQDEDLDHQDNHNPSLHEPWNVSTTGLDEVVIKKITMCKYKKGDGLIEGTDCSVCLSEFEEDEFLRLLPKCSHAFHVSCIDTWLKSHSNCPLCRANIVFPSSPSPFPPPPPLMEDPGIAANSWIQSRQVFNDAAVTSDMERNVSDEEILQQNDWQRVLINSGNLERERESIIEIGDERHQHIRRSFSMDHPCHGSRASIADMLRLDQDHDGLSEEAGSSKNFKPSSHRRRRVLHGVLSPVSMKRSFSSGRSFFNRHGRVRDNIINLV